MIHVAFGQFVSCKCACRFFVVCVCVGLFFLNIRTIRMYRGNSNSQVVFGRWNPHKYDLETQREDKLSFSTWGQ